MSSLRAVLVLFLAFGCSNSKTLTPQSRDIFDIVFDLKKNPQIDRAKQFLGQPTSIELRDPQENIDDYFFEKKGDIPSMNLFVDRANGKIVSYAIVFWAQIDGYEYMRERFKGHKWIETALPSKAVHHPEDLNRVEIPDLGIIFDYDNQDPLRRPLWIFVK